MAAPGHTTAGTAEGCVPVALLKSRASGGKVYLSRDEPFARYEASLNALKLAVAGLKLGQRGAR